MKKFTPSILLLFISTFALAQDTIRTQDMPGAGSNYTMSIGQTFTGIDVVGTGANHNWDFTQLGRTSQRIDSVISPSQTDPLLSFFFINSPLNTNRSNLAMKGGNFNLGTGGATTGLTNVFNYYYNSQNSYEQTGFGASVQGAPLPIAYVPHDVLYNFPLKFGDVDSVTYNYTVNLTQIIGFFYSVDRTRHNEVDGWGMLSTPFGNFSAVRVKSTLVESDSIRIDTLIHTGFRTPPTTTFEYKWLAPGMGLPLLQINTSATNAITSIVYQDSSHTIGVDEISGIISDATIFPNPAKDKIFVKYNMLKQGSVQIEFLTAEGKLILQKQEQPSNGEQIIAIDLINYKLPAGNYFLKLHTDKSEIVKPVNIY